MNNLMVQDTIRFLGPHRCPRCRMPLRAEELLCPCCDLEIVYRGESGELMIEMVAIDDPGNPNNSIAREYLEILKVERVGDMRLAAPLPVRARRAVVIPQKDGTLGIAYSNMVTLDDMTRHKD